MKGLYKDFFLHRDILIMFILFLSGVVAVLYHGFNYFRFFCILFGILIFVFSEYLTHRFLFHMKLPKNRLFLQFLKRLHYDHHLYPNDLKLLFLPIWYSLPNFSLLLVIFYWAERDIFNTISFGIGLSVMLLFYEWKHYIAHRPIRPKSKFGKWMKKTHLLHHFKNENYWFGVSNPMPDFLFGTFKNEKEIEMSETAKNLEKKV